MPLLPPSARWTLQDPSNVILSLTEDTVTAALATALSTLPYASANAKRWISAVSSLKVPPPPPSPQPRLKPLFALFTGSYYPVLDGFGVEELAGCWHISHYLDIPAHHCFAVEETLLQRFAAGEMGPVGGGGGSSGSGAAGAAAGAAAQAGAGSKRKQTDYPGDWAAALSTAPGELWERLERRSATCSASLPECYIL